MSWKQLAREFTPHHLKHMLFVGSAAILGAGVLGPLIQLGLSTFG